MTDHILFMWIYQILFIGKNKNSSTTGNGTLFFSQSYLSLYVSRNFVVQHVLSLHNPQFTAEICSRLRDHYSQLSLNQRGSHVVEKCITSSPLGMTYAVQEFLENKKVLCQIARNEFGNYVIQRALKITKVITFIHMYFYSYFSHEGTTWTILKV